MVPILSWVGVSAAYLQRIRGAFLTLHVDAFPYHRALHESPANASGLTGTRISLHVDDVFEGD
jgi:hypothetical protein